MRVGIYGRAFDDTFIPNIQELFNTIKVFGWDISVYEPFYAYLSPRITLDFNTAFFNKHHEVKGEIDILLSIGGDGTFLETIHIIRDSGIPILGINTGRLGFLASTYKDEIRSVLESIRDKKYRLQERSLLTLITNDNLFGEDKK